MRNALLAGFVITRGERLVSMLRASQARVIIEQRQLARLRQGLAPHGPPSRSTLSVRCGAKEGGS
jgi:hypothetical protein